MTDTITFASKLTDFELGAFLEKASKVECGLLNLASITANTGAEVQLRAARQSVSMLTQMVIDESKKRCSGG